MGKIEEHEGKKYLMVHDYMLHKEIDNIKRIIGIEKFDDTNILVDMDAELLEDIAFKNVMILMTCPKKDDDKYYPQIFLRKHYMLNKYVKKHF